MAPAPSPFSIAAIGQPGGAPQPAPAAPAPSAFAAPKAPAPAPAQDPRLDPNGFKARILSKSPDGVASDGTPYAKMDALDLVKRVVAKYPDGVTSDGHKYSDFLPSPDPRKVADQTSGKDNGAFFPASTTGNGGVKNTLSEMGKTVANIPGSAFNFIKGTAQQLLHPIQTVKNVVQHPIQSLVPAFGRDLAKAGGAFIAHPIASIKGESNPALDEGLAAAQRDVTNDPVGSILPFIAAAEGGAKVLDKVGVTADAAGAFDRGVSKTAAPVISAAEKITKPVGAAFGKGVDMAKEAGKFAASQATGLNRSTLEMAVKSPELLDSNLDRATLGKQIQSELAKRQAAIKDTGSGYDEIRNLKAVDKSVATGDTKVIKEGKNSIVYDLKEAPNEKLSLPELRRKAELTQQDTSGTYTKKDINALNKEIAKREVAEPVPHVVTVTPTYLERTIGKTTGLKFEDGQVKATGSSAIREAKDVRALQNLYDLWKPTFEKGKLTTSEFLNFRSDLAKLSKFEREIGKSAPLEDLSKKMRANFNKNHRVQVPGLEALDEQFSTQKGEYKELSRNLVDKNGNLTDASINRIANATGKGKDLLIGRLEEIKPGISQQIKALKAIEDIQHAKEFKVGTYMRAAFGGGGLVAGVATMNIPLIAASIAEMALTNPDNAIAMLKKYGATKPLMDATIEKIKSGVKTLNKGTGNFITTPDALIGSPGNDSKGAFGKK